jgi:hypothetical protein
LRECDALLGDDGLTGLILIDKIKVITVANHSRLDRGRL